MKYKTYPIIILLFLSMIYILQNSPVSNGMETHPTVEIIFQNDLIHVDVSGDENVSVKIEGHLLIEWTPDVDKINVFIKAYDLNWNEWNISADINKPSDKFFFDFNVIVKKHAISEKNHITVWGIFDYESRGVDWSRNIDNATYIMIDPYYDLTISNSYLFEEKTLFPGDRRDYNVEFKENGNSGNRVEIIVINEDYLKEQGIEVIINNNYNNISIFRQDHMGISINVSDSIELNTYIIELGFKHYGVDNRTMILDEDLTLHLKINIEDSNEDVSMDMAMVGMILSILLCITGHIAVRKRDL